MCTFEQALEGWLSNAGYLSMDKENEIHRSHRTNDHSISSDVKMHSEAFQHSEAEPVMERHVERHVERNVERIGAMALNHLSQERPSEMLGPIETNEHLERRATSLRRTSVLEERNYQALATERAAAEAKLRKDLRAVALERWSEPLNPERRSTLSGWWCVDMYEWSSTCCRTVLSDLLPRQELLRNAEALFHVLLKRHISIHGCV